MGYQFVEAKASVLNDKVHQTYKVGCDMFFILDLTQVGCLPVELKDKKCDYCGKGKDGNAFPYLITFHQLIFLNIILKDKFPKNIRKHIIMKRQVVYIKRNYLCVLRIILK